MTALPRITTCDITLGDTDIPAGSVVAVNVAAANRDPAHVTRPDDLDLTRGDVQHLSFGHGTHFCLGAALARMEAQVALCALVERHPAITLAVPAEQLRWRAGIVRGLVGLPVRL
jgi:cytochrome P450